MIIFCTNINLKVKRNTEIFLENIRGEGGIKREYDLDDIKTETVYKLLISKS